MKIISSLIFTLVCIFSVFSQEARKIDEFGNISCEDYLSRINNIFYHSRENPSANIYILVYEGKELIYNYRKKKEELVFPQYGLANYHVYLMKMRLESFSGVDIERFVFIKAGFRESFGVEFWLVPTGATPPKQTPTLTKIKYRKGKPKSFCLACC